MYHCGIRSHLIHQNDRLNVIDRLDERGGEACVSKLRKPPEVAAKDTGVGSKGVLRMQYAPSLLPARPSPRAEPEPVSECVSGIRSDSSARKRVKPDFWKGQSSLAGRSL